MPPLDSAFKNRNNYDRFHEFPLLDIATEGLNSAHSTDTLCSAFPSRTLSVGGAVMLSTTEIIVIGVIFGMVLLALMGALLYLWFKRTCRIPNCVCSHKRPGPRALEGGGRLDPKRNSFLGITLPLSFSELDLGSYGNDARKRLSSAFKNQRNYNTIAPPPEVIRQKPRPSWYSPWVTPEVKYDYTRPVDYAETTIVHPIRVYHPLKPTVPPSTTFMNEADKIAIERDPDSFLQSIQVKDHEEGDVPMLDRNNDSNMSLVNSEDEDIPPAPRRLGTIQILKQGSEIQGFRAGTVSGVFDVLVTPSMTTDEGSTSSEGGNPDTPNTSPVKKKPMALMGSDPKLKRAHPPRVPNGIMGTGVVSCIDRPIRIVRFKGSGIDHGCDTFVWDTVQVW